LLHNTSKEFSSVHINLLNAELNPICHLLALLGAHHILHVSRIRVKKTSLEALNLAELLELKFPIAGTIQTMNFAVNGRHLADQDYTICMRQEEGKNGHCRRY